MIELDVYQGESFLGNVAEIYEDGNPSWRGCTHHGVCADWPEREQAVNWLIHCHRAKTENSAS